MIDAVNDAGVDLNMACEQEHMRGLLQFVAGLGPRKAAALRTRISQVHAFNFYYFYYFYYTVSHRSSCDAVLSIIQPSVYFKAAVVATPVESS
jgi:Helix-hairpin-helix motif